MELVLVFVVVVQENERNGDFSWLVGFAINSLLRCVSPVMHCTRTDFKNIYILRIFILLAKHHRPIYQDLFTSFETKKLFWCFAFHFALVTLCLSYTCLRETPRIDDISCSYATYFDDQLIKTFFLISVEASSSSATIARLPCQGVPPEKASSECQSRDMPGALNTTVFPSLVCLFHFVKTKLEISFCDRFSLHN